MGKRIYAAFKIIGASWVSGRILGLLGFFLFFQSAIMHADEIYPLPTAKQESQFRHLLTELRCLVCQNQDLADSHAGLANDLRNEVYERVKAGESDSSIVQYLTDRYGDFILFKPPLKSMTFFLWFAPVIFLTLGLVIFWRRFRV
jgi:cytochrome c-type biogenesis protein CcmH